MNTESGRQRNDGEVIRLQRWFLDGPQLVPPLGRDGACPVSFALSGFLNFRRRGKSRLLLEVRELDPAHRLHSAVFSTSHNGGRSEKLRAYIRPGVEMSRLERVCATWLENDCTNSGHSLVDELHSIDFKRDKTASFYLTLKFKGVKTHSFFDNF
jgi:hypothetical protein